MGLGACNATNSCVLTVREMSESKPQVGDLAEELDQLTWSETARLSAQLGMKSSVLREIRESKQRDDIKLLKTMELWLKSDQNASWKRVVRALNAIRKNVLAQEMEWKYCRPAPASRSAADSALHAVGVRSFSRSRPVANPEAAAPSIARASAGMDSSSTLSQFSNLALIHPCVCTAVFIVIRGGVVGKCFG